ncbi:hypothetical protein ACFW4K_00245 [Nocardiopsis alba]|uniref:hypothetical protein n=1 Tax=Nocardiopsis alba TaxID=53437 RepID=UPI0036715D39
MKTRTPLDHHNVLRDLLTIMRKAGLDENEWSSRAGPSPFVPLLSGCDVSIEEISLPAGHKGTDTAERVYRRRLRPVRPSEAVEASENLCGVG